MTADLTSTATFDFVTVLSQAAATYQGHRSTRPSAEILVNALLQAEKATKGKRVTYPFESLLGKWQLCFVTGTKKVRERGGIVLGKGLYVPSLSESIFPLMPPWNRIQAEVKLLIRLNLAHFY